MYSCLTEGNTEQKVFWAMCFELLSLHLSITFLLSVTPKCKFHGVLCLLTLFSLTLTLSSLVRRDGFFLS